MSLMSPRGNLVHNN